MKIRHKVLRTAEHKASTIVGEVYEHENYGIVLRVQGAFAKMQSGELVSYVDAYNNGYVHLPEAELVI